jgi:secreted trypsin-like serine protease
MYSRRHTLPRLWAIAVAVIMGAGAAFAAIATGEAESGSPGAQAKPGDQASTLASTPQSPAPPPDPILPFNAKLTAHNIPVPGGGVRTGGCSGALIAPEWIITAGHCFHNGKHVRREGKPLSTVTVTVGKLKDSDPGGHTAEVIDVRQSPVNDIAVARLATPVAGVVPLTLADAPPAVGQQLGFAGWGSLSATVVAQTDHMKRGQFAVLAVKGTTLEADSVVPRTVENSPCPQDSGAPFFISEDERTGVLVAVESTGPPCPEPGVETISRVDVVAEWIRQQTGITAP